MLENSKEGLRTLILLEFTRSLIIEKNPTLFLETLNKPKIKKDKFINKIESRVPRLKKEIITKQRIKPTQRLRVPETRLPPQFAYLKPGSRQKIKLNFGKLEPLIKDPAIKIIEVNGANQQTIVKGNMGSMPTNTILTEEEIKNIINEFSKKSKIPIEDGLTKIALGDYILSAIGSEENGLSFIIKKIAPNPPKARR